MVHGGTSLAVWLVTKNVSCSDSKITSLFLGLDTVPIGGSSKVRLPKEDYAHVKSAGKPTAMALRHVNRLFSKETLMKSTVHGTKEFAALDATVIAAIKGKLTSQYCFDASACGFK